MSKTSWLLVVVLLVIVVGVIGYRATEAQPAAAPNAVGVIDLAKVLLECQEYVDLQTEMKQRTQAIQAKLDDMSTEVEAMERELQEAVSGADEHRDMLREYFTKRAEYEAFGKSQNAAFAMENQARFETIYKKAMEEIARVARQRALCLVLAIDGSDARAKLIAGFEQKVNPVIDQRVLYASPTADITAVVIENLDTSYESSKN